MTEQNQSLQKTKLTQEHEIYGSFTLNKNEVALNVKSIQEVVNFPGKVTPMPLAPDYIVGIFDLRGTIIPVISLKTILRLDDNVEHTNQKIAIVERENARVGFLFDSTGEIFRLRSEDISEFKYNEQDSSNVIKGAIKLDDGKRLIEIINPEELVKIRNLPHLKSKEAGEKSQRGSAVKGRGAGKNQCISFMVKDRYYAFDIDNISEIVNKQEIRQSSLETDLCRGFINLRGNVVPVLDFAKLTGYEEASREELGEHKFIVIKMREHYFGLIVKEVDNIIRYDKEDVLPIPVFGKTRAEMFLGCLPQGADRPDILMLNHEKVLTNEEVAKITKGHANLYQTEMSKNLSGEEGSHSSSDRVQLLVFQLVYKAGLPISDINEIINFPGTLIKPPTMRPHILGLFNLRGELIPLFDTRGLFGMEILPPKEGQSKVLVMRKGEERLGFIVDSVDSILNLAMDERIEAPKLLVSQAEETFRSEMTATALVQNKSTGQEEPLVILDTEALLAKI